jgi:RimJ/RimL family protein N-acetyltransferase
MRLRLSAKLDAPRQLPPSDPLARGVVSGDAAALAELMFDAYRGTVDDEGEGPEGARAEIASLFAGQYGPFDFGASEVVVRDGRIVAATLVTQYQGLAMVAFTMTAPPWQRRGLARAGLIRTMARLLAAGRDRVDLAVTETNTPARRLYDSLGFEVVR